MVQTTNITVYLQALGAHFLGKNAYNVNNISVNLVYSGGIVNLPYLYTNQNDGLNQPNFTTGQSSFMPIINPATSGVTFLNTSVNSTNNHTTCAIATGFTLPAAIELAHLDISVPTTTTNAPITIKYPVWLSPLRSTYTITVAVPGLYLHKINFPNQSTLQNKTIGVLVKMMCGCAITAPANPPLSLWHPNDFIVQATVVDATGTTSNFTLSYIDNPAIAPNSLFGITLPATCNPRHITYTALQKSTNNYGTLAVTMP